MNKFEFNKLCPFKWFVLENFPFIEADFDAITNYQLYCKVVEYLNKVIENNNAIGIQTENLTDAFIELQDYVNNYFDNLDVQDEINNKLDEMATDGTLENIINQEIFGDIQTELQNLDTKITNETNNLKRNALYIGNSYTDGVGSTTGNNGIFNLTKNLFNNAYKKTSGGIGFLPYTDHTDTFQTMLQNAINDSNINNDEITDIIIIGAWGDTRALHEATNYSTYSGNVQTAIINFVTLAKNNFSNIKRISYVLAESRANKVIDTSTIFDDAFWVHNRLSQLLPKNGIEYLGWIGFNLLLTTSYFSNDKYHPSDLGYTFLSSLFKTAYNGTLKYNSLKYNWSGRPCQIIDGSQLRGNIVLTPNEAEFNIENINLVAGDTPTHGTEIELFNFANNLNFSLPMPTGQESSYEIENGFTCTTQYANDNNFSFNNNYNAKIKIQRNSEEPNSLVIIAQTLGNAKTITGTPSLFNLPSKFSWKL